MPGVFGDSPSATIVGHWLTPSSREMRTSAPARPIVTIESRLMFDVRSGLIAVQESPRSVDLNTRFAAASRMCESFGEIINGVSQCQRSDSVRGMPDTFPDAGFGRMFL